MSRAAGGRHTRLRCSREVPTHLPALVKPRLHCRAAELQYCRIILPRYCPKESSHGITLNNPPTVPPHLQMYSTRPPKKGLADRSE